MAFEEQIDVTSQLHDVRTSAIKNFENKGFPTKKEEAWKYTSLNAILKNDFTVFPKHENAIEFAEVKKYFLHEIDTYKVIFVDGKFSSFLSSTTHDGLDAVSYTHLDVYKRQLQLLKLSLQWQDC